MDRAGGGIRVRAVLREVWGRWLAERRHRSLRELLEAVGFIADLVGLVLRGER